MVIAVPGDAIGDRKRREHRAHAETRHHYAYCKTATVWEPACHQPDRADPDNTYADSPENAIAEINGQQRLGAARPNPARPGDRVRRGQHPAGARAPHQNVREAAATRPAVD